VPSGYCEGGDPFKAGSIVGCQKWQGQDALGRPIRSSAWPGSSDQADLRCSCSRVSVKIAEQFISECTHYVAGTFASVAAHSTYRDSTSSALKTSGQF